jgi:hypothetical protein
MVHDPVTSMPCRSDETTRSFGLLFFNGLEPPRWDAQTADHLPIRTMLATETYFNPFAAQPS